MVFYKKKYHFNEFKGNQIGLKLNNKVVGSVTRGVYFIDSFYVLNNEPFQ